MNYVDHCEEQNYPVPDEPILFSKFNSSITHPGSPVHLTAETQELDYEVEMAFVVCKEGKNVKVQREAVMECGVGEGESGGERVMACGCVGGRQ